MTKVLIISGHPDLESSTANAAVLAEIEQTLPGVEIRRLDTLYPDCRIDVAAEQQALLAADVLVLQAPMHWYHLPALLQKWLSDVFTFGFAYGSARQLQGKKLIVSLTTGAPETAYRHDGAYEHTIGELGYGYGQTAKLCGLQFGGIIHTGGMLYIPGVSNEADRELVLAKAKTHAARVLEAVK